MTILPILSCRRLRDRGGWAEDAQNKRCTKPIGPRNTYSNLSYALAALWLVDNSPDPLRFPMAAWLLLLCVGSSGYHAFKTTFWNNMDWAGMYSTMAVLVIHGLKPDVPGGLLGGFTVGAVGAMLFAFQIKHFDLLMGGLFAVAAIPPLWSGNQAVALLSVGLFALAFLFWQADKRRWKMVGLYGHAAWHVFTAAAMVALFVAQT